MLSVKKKSIVFNRDKDIFLCREVLARNPFKNPDAWDKIAEKITDHFELQRPCTKRTVSDRVELMMKNWRKSENESKLKSGPDEPYSEYESCMIDIAGLYEEEQLLAARKKETKKKDKNEQETGIMIRDQAMYAVKKRTKDSEDSDEEDDGDMPELQPETHFAPLAAAAEPVEWELFEDIPDDTLKLAGYDSDTLLKRPKKSEKESKGRSLPKKMKGKKKMKQDKPADPFMELMSRRLDIEEAREKRLEQERAQNETFQKQVLTFFMNKGESK